MNIIFCPECGGKHVVEDHVEVALCATCKNDQAHVKQRTEELQLDPLDPIKKWRLRSAQRQQRYHKEKMKLRLAARTSRRIRKTKLDLANRFLE